MESKWIGFTNHAMRLRGSNCVWQSQLWTRRWLPGEAWCEILHKKDDLEAAGEQLDQAVALFRDMGMVWWSGQSEGLRGRIGGGEPFRWFAPYVDGPLKIEG